MYALEYRFHKGICVWTMGITLLILYYNILNT